MRLEQIYDEFQTPILGMVLYFLLQLPYIQKIFIRNFSHHCSIKMDFTLYLAIWYKPHYLE